MVALGTCPFRVGESGCTPLPIPSCPTDQLKGVHFNLATGGMSCIGEVSVSVEPTSGKALLRWESVERAPDSRGDCRLVSGSERAGTAEVVGSCCETVLDLPMVGAGIVFRLVARTDWKE